MESKYIEKKAYLSRYTHERELVVRESDVHLDSEFGRQSEWSRCDREDFPKFIPFLRRKCGLEFSGRVLEIGAGTAWLSAELSKLPKVVEIIATDFSPKLLKEEAPKVFKLLNAKSAKITRIPGDFHKLDFPPNHFDFVVCSAVLHQAMNMVQVLREVKRVLKSGGKFVAIREPIWPLAKLKSRAQKASSIAPSRAPEHVYTLGHYKELFKQAGLILDAKRVNLSGGVRYYVNEVINGLTHARYALIATKKVSAPRR